MKKHYVRKDFKQTICQARIEKGSRVYFIELTIQGHLTQLHKDGERVDYYEPLYYITIHYNFTGFGLDTATRTYRMFKRPQHSDTCRKVINTFIREYFETDCRAYSYKTLKVSDRDMIKYAYDSIPYYEIDRKGVLKRGD